MKSSSSTDWKIGDKGKTSQGEIVTIKKVVGSRYLVIKENLKKKVYIPAHGEIEKIDNDIEYVKCPVCNGNPRRWLSYEECISNCVHPGSYEDCTNCEDGYVPID